MLHRREFALHCVQRAELGRLDQGAEVLRTRAHLHVAQTGQFLEGPVLLEPDLEHQVNRPGSQCVLIKLYRFVVNHTELDEVPSLKKYQAR